MPWLPPGRSLASALLATRMRSHQCRIKCIPVSDECSGFVIFTRSNGVRVLVHFLKIFIIQAEANMF
jgi:hypothetical protein